MLVMGYSCPRRESQGPGWSASSCPHLEKREKWNRHRRRTVAGAVTGLSQVLNKYELNRCGSSISVWSIGMDGMNRV